MKYNNITATIDSYALKCVMTKLREIGVPGVTVFNVSGYGEYKNFFRKLWIGQHKCVRIYAPIDQTDKFVQAIIDTAYTGGQDDGIITVNPVEDFYFIRDHQKVI